MQQSTEVPLRTSNGEGLRVKPDDAVSSRVEARVRVVVETKLDHTKLQSAE